MDKARQLTLNSRIRTIAVPAMIGFLFNTLFNVVDSFYAGQISTDAIAGMTLAFPVFFLLMSLASGIGNGLNALAAIEIGANAQKNALSLFKNALYIALGIGLVVPFVAPSVAEFIFDMQNAETAPKTYALQYITVVMGGFIFFMINFTLNGFLYAQGNTKPFRNFLIVASIINIGLNPLLIHGVWLIPALNTAGIGLATVLVQMGGSVYLFSKARRSSWFLHTMFKRLTFSKADVLSLAKQGIPATMNNATIALGVFVINFYVQFYGGSQTLAAYGIAIRIEQLALVPTLGINVAVITLVGQYFGAGERTQILKVWKRSTLIGLMIMTAGIMFIFPFSSFLIALFDDTEAVVSAGTRYLRIEALAFLSYVILNITVSMLQGIKKPMFALYIGIYRQLIPIGLFYLLGTVLSMGIDGVWWGIVIINWTAVIIAVSYGWLSFKRTLPVSEMTTVK